MGQDIERAEGSLKGGEGNRDSGNLEGLRAKGENLARKGVGGRSIGLS